jgi:hypothetical protein
MKLKNIGTNFIIVLLVILLCHSCASVNSIARKITTESGEIPPDMKTEEFIMIGTLKNKENYDKYLEKEYANYTGKYVLATEQDITNKYNDVNKYRYIMDYKEERSEHYSSMSGSMQKVTSTGFRYFILGRKVNKKYLRKSRSSFFALEIRAYLIAIEAARKR